MILCTTTSSSRQTSLGYMATAVAVEIPDGTSTLESERAM